MILSCPSCTVRFNVKVEALGTKGRNVKCSKCGLKWFATVGELRPRAPISTSPQTAASSAQNLNVSEGAGPTDNNENHTQSADRQPLSHWRHDEQRMHGSGTKFHRWFLAVAVIAALLSASIFWRAELVYFFEPANKVFTMLNLPVEELGNGLVIHALDNGFSMEGENRVLTISGQIENTTHVTLAVPTLQALLRDSKGIEVHKWTFLADESAIPPGKRITYKSRVLNPENSPTGFEISFTNFKNK